MNHQRLVDSRLKANCPLVGRGPIGSVPSVWVFLKDPSPYLRENHQRKRSNIHTHVKFDKREHFSINSFYVTKGVKISNL